MRVAQLIETLATGGAEKLAVDIANDLAARGHDSHLVILKSGGPFQRRVAPGVTLHELDRPRQDGNPVARFMYFLETARRLESTLLGAGVEVLQTHLPKANFLGLRLGQRRVCRVHPTVHNNREFDYGDNSGPLKTFLRKRAYGQMLSSCAAMIAVSDQVRAGMIEQLGIDTRRAARIAVVTNGVAVPPPAAPAERLRARQARGIAPDEFLIVGMGRLSPQKDFASLVTALAHWAPAAVPWRCIIAGEGELRGDLAAQITAAGLDERVALPGHERDVPGLLAAADVFCLPSRYEGLPLALMEAMAAGLPVCAFAIDGVVELVSDGVQGVLAPSRTATDLAAGLQRLAADPDECREMGAAARALIARDFNFTRVVDQLEEIYRS